MIFSIITPTYNSEKTLKYTLDSIKRQNFDLSKVEVLIIDGGSTDKTLEIAAEYPFCKILHNEKRLPEFAKLIGFKEASGKYIIKMDSDESFPLNNTLIKRFDAFSQYPDAHICVADRLICTENNKSIAGNYINTCGDPFTFFMYRQKKNVSNTFCKNKVKTNNGTQSPLFCFNLNDIHPIGDGGTTTVDLEYIKNNFSDWDNISFISSVTDKVIEKSGYCIIIDQDCVMHRSSCSAKRYFKKIKFRIINNIFAPSESGFSSRKISKNSFKKYLFIPYAFLTPAFFDSILLTLRYKDITMMMHCIYSVYTAWLIIWYMFLKVIGKEKKNLKYS